MHIKENCMKLLVIVVLTMLITACPPPSPSVSRAMFITAANPTVVEFTLEEAGFVTIKSKLPISFQYLRTSIFQDNVYSDFFEGHDLTRYKLTNLGDDPVYVFLGYFEENPYEASSRVGVSTQRSITEMVDTHNISSDPIRFGYPDSRGGGYFEGGGVTHYNFTMGNELFNSFLEGWRREYCPEVADIAQLSTCRGLVIIQPDETKPFHYDGCSRPVETEEEHCLYPTLKGEQQKNPGTKL